MHMVILAMINLNAKFKCLALLYSFQRYVGDPKCDPENAHLGVVCHRKASTCDGLPTY